MKPQIVWDLSLSKSLFSRKGWEHNGVQFYFLYQEQYSICSGATQKTKVGSSKVNGYDIGVSVKEVYMYKNKTYFVFFLPWDTVFSPFIIMYAFQGISKLRKRMS